MPKNTPMRRKDRQVTDEDAIRFILMNQEVLHLGLPDSDRIYVVPVNYAFTYEGRHLALYFHGAKAGLKYDILKTNPQVGFCIDGDQVVIPDERDASRFTTHYKSVIGSGRVSMIQEREEAKKAFSLFMKHYSPRDWDITDAMAERAAIFRLDAEEFQVKVNR